METDLYCDIKAESKEDALRIAEDMDGGNFIEDGRGSWKVYEAIELYDFSTLLHKVEDSLSGFLLHELEESGVHYGHFMHKDGLAYFKLYGFKDNLDSENTNELYIESLSVTKENRKRGIGSAIMNAVKSNAEKQKYDLYLFVDWGSWMYAWYERLGFKDFGRHKERGNISWMQKKH